MALLVQKFGGTSLGSMTRIEQAAEIVAKTKAAGHDVVVIVSAMAGETDRLIQLAKAIQDVPTPREYAALVATGEQVSMTLMAMALQAKGIDALSMTGAQAGIHTSSHYTKARIHGIQTDSILNEVKQGRVVVIAGFQGVDEAGQTTTLGRGGSDTSAVAVAAALHADECQIYTDVEGIFTTDPNVVSEARRLDSITFEEMLELASLGSKVLQLRSVEFAGRYNMPLRVLSAQNPGPGTLISYEKKQQMEAPLVSGIAFSRQETQLILSGLKDSFEALPSILEEINTLGVNIDMLTHSKTPGGAELSFTVHQDEYLQTFNHFKQHLDKVGAKALDAVQARAKLSLVGAGLKSHPDVAATLFKTLASEKIQVQLLSMSEIKLSVLIDASKLDTGVKRLHQAFCLDSDEAVGDYSQTSPLVYSEH